MSTISVGALSFRFDDDWQVSKYDDWSFYRKRFQRIRSEVKAIDVLAIASDRTVWFIEVKDYRQHPRTKPINLADEVAHKVFDTLAALLPAHLNGDVDHETAIAKAALNGRALRVVLHLEQPAIHSKLFSPCDRSRQRPHEAQAARQVDRSASARGRDEPHGVAGLDSDLS